MPKTLWPLLLIISLCGCTHFLSRNDQPYRGGSPECTRLRQSIQSPDYAHESTGPLYTPADQARLIQMYDQYGC